MNNLEKALSRTKEQIEQQNTVDRDNYLMGRRAYPTPPSENLSERARGAYMMGYNVSEWEYAYNVH